MVYTPSSFNGSHFENSLKRGMLKKESTEISRILKGVKKRMECTNNIFYIYVSLLPTHFLTYAILVKSLIKSATINGCLCYTYKNKNTHYFLINCFLFFFVFFFNIILFYFLLNVGEILLIYFDTIKAMWSSNNMLFIIIIISRYITLYN